MRTPQSPRKIFRSLAVVAAIGLGAAADVVATWVEVLSGQASDIVRTATIEADAAAILAAMPPA